MIKQAFSVPIKIDVGVNTKKSIYLNLNKYRNWHFHVNNQLKKLFKIQTIEAMRQLKPMKPPYQVTYLIYYENRRRFDIDNIGAVVGKFTHDALIEAGVIEDDCYTYISRIIYEFGGIDSKNPRCDVIIEEIEND
tara:strand:+ start:402 stop:806 length:405 start_codon:yes stop_codon:yes gene_type:complete